MQTTLVIHDMNNYRIKKEGKTMKVLCGHCFNKEEYITKKVIVTDVFNKEEVTYFKTIAYCSKCGNEVYVEEIEEKNLEAYQDAYCQKNGIVKLSSIRQIPILYNIGIRPLSKLLGFGEITYTRYCEGYIPKHTYSDILMRIESDPQYFLLCLEKGKNRITDCAYEKAKKAAMLAIDKQKENNINCVLSRYSFCDSITSTQYAEAA